MLPPVKMITEYMEEQRLAHQKQQWDTLPRYIKLAIHRHALQLAEESARPSTFKTLVKDD